LFAASVEECITKPFILSSLFLSFFNFFYSLKKRKEAVLASSLHTMQSLCIINHISFILRAK
jgi:hypothetical protein